MKTGAVIIAAVVLAIVALPLFLMESFLPEVAPAGGASQSIEAGVSLSKCIRLLDERVDRLEARADSLPAADMLEYDGVVTDAIAQLQAAAASQGEALLWMSARMDSLEGG